MVNHQMTDAELYVLSHVAKGVAEAAAAFEKKARSNAVESRLYKLARCPHGCTLLNPTRSPEQAKASALLWKPAKADAYELWTGDFSSNHPSIPSWKNAGQSILDLMDGPQNLVTCLPI